MKSEKVKIELERDQVRRLISACIDIGQSYERCRYKQGALPWWILRNKLRDQLEKFDTGIEQSTTKTMAEMIAGKLEVILEVIRERIGAATYDFGGDGSDVAEVLKYWDKALFGAIVALEEIVAVFSSEEVSENPVPRDR